MANYELISLAVADELACAAASAWLGEVEVASRARGNFCVALSGGRITQKFYAAAVEQGRERGFSFANVHFFWADERCVPPAHPDSNFKLADELLFQPLKIAADHIHRLRGELPPETTVALANEELRRFAATSQAGQPALDLVILGMGEDGHVASLFPNATQEALNSREPFLAVDNSPKPPPSRISLSYAAIASARRVWVLASGTGKEDVLRQSLSADGKTPLAQVIQSRSGVSPVRIFTDLM